ncbi:MAG: response regulator transcription factor [Saprospiraceae bacterium]|nr:response regulator transcription factor [Saprospiraceae bacterium]
MSKPTIRVAIAEDQRLFRECLIPVINQFENMEVCLEASNGRELLDALAQGIPLPDVVLMDLTMPELNGMETTEQIKVRYPEIKVIILSVHGEERHIVKLVGIGVNAYLVKNAELTEVRRAIESVVEKGFYFNEATLRALQAGMEQRKQKTFDPEMTLTTREREILELICKECTTPEIAERLFISVRTVDGHRNNLLAKTGARNTAGLVLYALRHSLVELFT